MLRHALRSRALRSRAPSSWRRSIPVTAAAQNPGPPSRHFWSKASHHGPTRRPPLVNSAGTRTHPQPYRRLIASLSLDNDTIYALSSAPGRAGIAVIRISGPACTHIYTSLCPSSPLPKPRYAAVRTLYEPVPKSGPEREAPCRNILDSSALVLSFPAPRTVTGEDVLELHVHGGPATVKAVLAAIGKCARPSPGPNDDGRARQSSIIRYAEPGEFTRRAFLNDRLDLAQVEGLSDALAAETEQQRRAAVRGSSGSLGRTYEAWRARLLHARAEIEALIDFSEDQHFDESPAQLLGGVAARVKEIVRAIERHEVAAGRTELLTAGIRIALLGPPNAGKSSLMNLVVGREASIVSSEAGTTRDVVEARLDLGGYLCSFADTAGFRSVKAGHDGEGEEIGTVEMEGIKRARRKAEEADVVVVLASIETVGLSGDSAAGKRVVFDAETIELARRAKRCLVVVNKRDAVADESEFAALVADFKARAGLDLAPLAISCREAAEKNGVARRGSDPGGVHELVLVLIRCFGELTELPADMQDLLGVTERQRQLLVQCRGHLEDFLTEARAAGGEGDAARGGGEADVVLAAEHLRAAAECLARITGRGDGGDVEEVLGVIFEKFCVGK